MESTEERREMLDALGVTEDEVQRLFGQLAAELDRVPLRTSGGGVRVVPVDEFMLMHVNEREAQFKHRVTRCYLYLARQRFEAATSRGAATVYPGEFVTQLGATFDGYPDLDELEEVTT